MTYRDALAYLETLTNYERTHQPSAMRHMPLERMHLLCERFGHPQRRFRSILVAGTNGKGSICAMLYSILRQAGLRVGCYTSPHLEDIRERIRVSAECGVQSVEHADWITTREFAAAIGRLRPVVEELNARLDGGPLTYFEALTAVAFLQFAQQHVDVAVLEVGLGGRLDATNIVEQAVSLIGPIGLDHTDILGPDLASIAREKAGILKTPHVVISAPQPPEASEVLRDVAARRGCRLVEYGRHLTADVTGHQRDGLRMRLQGTRGSYEDLTVPLLGRHQAENAALAIAAVEALSEDGIPHAAIRAGLAAVQWPGRLEVLEERPLVVFDGAHNPAAAQVLRQTIEELWPGRAVHLLMGVSADKSLHAMAEAISPLVASVTCTASRHPRASAPEAVAQAWRPLCRAVAVIPDAADAYTCLLNTVAPEDLLLVTGSLFLVGELRAKIQHAKTHARPRARRSALSERR